MKGLIRFMSIHTSKIIELQLNNDATVGQAKWLLDKHGFANRWDCIIHAYDTSRQLDDDESLIHREMRKRRSSNSVLTLLISRHVSTNMYGIITIPFEVLPKGTHISIPNYNSKAQILRVYTRGRFEANVPIHVIDLHTIDVRKIQPSKSSAWLLTHDIHLILFNMLDTHDFLQLRSTCRALLRSSLVSPMRERIMMLANKKWNTIFM